MEGEAHRIMDFTSPSHQRLRFYSMMEESAKTALLPSLLFEYQCRMAGPLKKLLPPFPEVNDLDVEGK